MELYSWWHSQNVSLKSGYNDVGDGFLETKFVGDSFCHFYQQYPLSFYISVGHQYSKDVTNIEILSSTSLSPLIFHWISLILCFQSSSRLEDNFSLKLNEALNCLFKTLKNLSVVWYDYRSRILRLWQNCR